jgi:protein gp37
LIRECRRLDWLLLTKRPQNIERMLPADWGDGYRNVWLGATAENQAWFDRRRWG